MLSIFLALVVVVFVIKQWNGDSFIGFLRSLFFFEGLGGAEGEGWQDAYDQELFGDPNVLPQDSNAPDEENEDTNNENASDEEGEQPPRSFFVDVESDSSEGSVALGEDDRPTVPEIELGYGPNHVEDTNRYSDEDLYDEDEDEDDEEVPFAHRSGH